MVVEQKRSTGAFGSWREKFGYRCQDLGVSVGAISFMLHSGAQNPINALKVGVKRKRDANLELERSARVEL